MIGKKSKILKLIAISIVFIGIGFSSDFSFKKAELFIDGNTYVINILASKDLKGDKTQELICKLNTGEYGIGFVETGSSKLSLFIPIVIKDKKITDMAAGDIFNDRSNAIAAVADKKVYLFKLTKDNIIEEAGTIDLYKKGEYGRDKEDTEKYKKVASEDTIEGKSIAIGDVDGDGKQEIVITKTDSWIYGNYPTYIVQVFKWDPKGNEFKTISLSDDNSGVGDENITIDEINNYSVFLVGNKLRQIKLGNFGFVHNGISAIGKIGSSKVVAFCGIESVRKDGKVIGVTQVHFQRQFKDDLTPDNFKNLRTLQIRDFKKKGSYPPEFVSSAVEDYQSLVFADFDNDGKNELIINCKDSFAVIKEGRFLEVKPYVNPLEALKIVAKERFQKWEDKAGKMIQKEDFDVDHLKKITDAEEPEKLKWTNEEKEFKLGDIAYLQKKNDEAIAHYKECIKEIKDNSWVKYGNLRLADLYYKLNNKTESENTLNNFIKNYSDFENIGRAYLQLGYICQEQKRYKEAKEFYAKVKEAMKTKERPKDIDFRYATCAVESGAYEEAIPVLEKLDKDWFEKDGNIYNFKVQYLLAKSYESIGKTDEAYKWFKRYVGNTAKDVENREEAKNKMIKYNPVKDFTGNSENLLYVGEDYDTKADWIGYYGTHSYILCAYKGINDVTGGKNRPLFYKPRKSTRPARTKKLENTLIYTVDIDDETDNTRYFLPIYSPGAKTGLYNPAAGVYRSGSWDDHGEIYPRTRKGPDLIVKLSIPKGEYMLSFYYCWGSRRHEIKVFDSKENVLDEREIGDFSGGVYYRYLVKGPIDITKRIYRGNSLNTTLSGIFLDSIIKPEVIETKSQFLTDYKVFCKSVEQSELIKSIEAGETKSIIEKIDKNIPESKNVVDELKMKWNILRTLNKFEEEQPAFDKYVEEFAKTNGFEKTEQNIFTKDNFDLKVNDTRKVFVYNAGLISLYKKYKSLEENIAKITELAESNYLPMMKKHRFPNYSLRLIDEAIEINFKNTNNIENALRQSNEHLKNEVLRGYILDRVVKLKGNENISEKDQMDLYNYYKIVDGLDFNYVKRQYDIFFEKFPNSSYGENLTLDFANLAASHGMTEECVQIYTDFLSKYTESSKKSEVLERIKTVEKYVKKK